MKIWVELGDEATYEVHVPVYSAEQSSKCRTENCSVPKIQKKNFEHVKNFKHAIISITNVYM